ncbi:MAG: T9SS type A sorting domain-containing protein [Patescibacteria group bacterium]|nr:T9SS type A sorting domain-containing protein [Patescibacteria group bacterium]
MVMIIICVPIIIIAQPKTSILPFTTKYRIYDKLMNPREHPDDTRRHVQPPDWTTFDNRTQFMALRGFSIQNDSIVNYAREIEKYTQTFDLGNILWPSYPIIFTKNLNDLADEIKRRNLFLFDIWGYVPGSGPGGYWQQFTPPAGVFEMLETKLGDHWLGMDNGEQDGRYIGGYASQLYPASSSRMEQYFNFQRHFERLSNDLGNKLSTLVSLNFGHYFLKEGIYTLIGAETAQALPNSQVYYAFIRGAGKQYGVPWFGNASVFNRWGYKVYGSEGASDGYMYGPKKGTSLSLLKRLIYSHILYNCMCVGFESSFFEGNNLSPIGRIQQSAQGWIRQNGQPGVMLTPVAVLLDFFSGWSFPRHLYTGNVYRVWGNLPYEAGDHLTDGILDMLYPDYQNSSYYHDESGFISPTPYGDYADCLLSDAPVWLLKRYPLIVVAGELSSSIEIQDKLQTYIAEGGNLFVTAGNIAKFSDGFAGVKINNSAIHFNAGDTVKFESLNCSESYSFELVPLIVPSSAKILAHCKDVPAVINIPMGKGTVTIFASPFGISAERTATGTISSEIDKPLPKPYLLLNHFRVVLDEAFRSSMLFSVGENVSLITCRKEPGLYVLGIGNNSLQEKPFHIISNCGTIESIREIALDQSEKSAAGYLPEGFENANLGNSDDSNIAGGDVRLFEVRVHEENLESISFAAPAPRPLGRALVLRSINSIKEEILSRTTFFEHYDKVVVDWKYLRLREKDALRQESGWINRQGLGIIIDLTSGINLYPDLRLIENLESDYANSMLAIKDVMDKMGVIESHDLIVSFHRGIENNFTEEQIRASLVTTLKEICKYAAAYTINIHIRVTSTKPWGWGDWQLKDAVEFISGISASNLRLAPCTALLLPENVDLTEVMNLLQGKVGLWLVSAPEYDLAGRLWNTNFPIAGYNRRYVLTDIISIAPKSIIVLDGVYKNQDEEYMDSNTLKSITSLITEVKEKEQTGIPQEFKLCQNYPNPFNPVTTIKYQIPKLSQVTLKIFNILGQEIKTLINQNHQPGNFELMWDGTNNNGLSVSSGIYILRITTNKGYIKSIKMTLLK